MARVAERLASFVGSQKKLLRSWKARYIKVKTNSIRNS